MKLHQFGNYINFCLQILEQLGTKDSFLILDYFNQNKSRSFYRMLAYEYQTNLHQVLKKEHLNIKSYTQITTSLNNDFLIAYLEGKIIVNIIFIIYTCLYYEKYTKINDIDYNKIVVCIQQIHSLLKSRANIFHH